MPPADALKPTHTPFHLRWMAAFLRLFFKLLYHQFAWAYDGVAAIVSLGAWQAWIKSVLPYLGQGSTLEIGFGTGHLQLALHQQGIPTFGLDESAYMARITRTRLGRAGAGANLVRGEAACLPFATQSYAQLVMTFPSEFIIRTSTLSEIHRLLIPGGLAVILPVAWITGRKPWERFIAWVYHITGQAPAWDDAVLAPLHLTGFEVTRKMIPFPTSQVLVLCLRKSNKTV
jgi:ubiquinone/menaquinone biosynthesis C-methylase UbiE